jgi:glutaredoxin
VSDSGHSRVASDSGHSRVASDSGHSRVASGAASRRPGPRALLGLVLLILAASVAQQWWAARHDKSLGTQVAALAGPGDIRMLSSEVCAICTVARAWLRENKVPFSECLIERDANCRADHEAMRASGTPVLVVRGQPMQGWSPELLRSALERTQRG